MMHPRGRAWNFVWIGLATAGMILGGGEKAAAQDQKSDVTEVVRDTQKITNENGEMNLVWWLPEEFWKASVAANPGATPAQLEVFLKVVHPYFIVGVGSGKIGPFAAITYRTEAEVRGLVQLKDNEGNIYKPLPEEKIDASVSALLGLMKPGLVRAVGPLGENIHFFVFPGSRKDGTSVCDPMKEGVCEVDLGERVFKWRLPLGSVLPSRSARFAVKP